MAFLQIHDNFKAEDYNCLEAFVKGCSKEIPLALKLRNKEWFADQEIFNTIIEVSGSLPMRFTLIQHLLKMLVQMPTMIVRDLMTKLNGL